MARKSKTTTDETAPQQANVDKLNSPEDQGLVNLSLLVARDLVNTANDLVEAGARHDITFIRAMREAFLAGYNRHVANEESGAVYKNQIECLKDELETLRADHERNRRDYDDLYDQSIQAARRANDAERNLRAAKSALRLVGRALAAQAGDEDLD